MFIATIRNQNQIGATWHLKGTTWTSVVERADQFTSEAAAAQALARARQFMKPAAFKLARIEAYRAPLL